MMHPSLFATNDCKKINCDENLKIFGSWLNAHRGRMWLDTAAYEASQKIVKLTSYAIIFCYWTGNFD